MRHAIHHPCRPARRFRARGFTLTELLVVVLIVVVLASIVFVVAKRVRDSANNVKCTSNLRQIAAMMTAAATDNGGIYPRKAWAEGYKGGGLRYAPEHYMIGYDAFKKDASGKIIERAEPARDSLFCCPAERSPRDGGGQEWFQSHYGFNFYLVHTSAEEMKGANGTNPCRVPISSIRNPDRVFLVGDSKSSYSISAVASSIAFRHDGDKRWNVAFVDGHVESLTASESAFGWMQYIPWGGIHQPPKP